VILHSAASLFNLQDVSLAPLALDMFSQSVPNHLFRRSGEGLPCGNAFDTAEEACENSRAEREDDLCAKYCRLVANRREMQSAAMEIFKLGLHRNEESDSPEQFLGDCQRKSFSSISTLKSSNCWQRVVNHKGICYASNYGRKLFL